SYLEVDNGHLISSVEEAPRETIKFSILEDSPRLISNIIPKNPFSALIEGDMLAIVVFSILLGVAFSTHSAKETAPLFKVLNSFLDILMTIIKWAMFLSPWAVFGLMAQNASQLGVSALLGMSVFIVTVLLGLASLLMVYLLIAWVFTRHSPWEFLRNIAPVQLLAFSTSSSAAVMPLSIQVAEEKLGVDTSTAEFVIPLGTTMNMAGTALYQATTLLFLAQMSGIQLGGGQLALIIVSIIASSIGAPGTPGVSLVVLSAIAENFGIPVAGIAMILGIDRLLDMCRTTINVTGDLTACAIMNQAPQKSPSFTDRMKFSGEPA
ncbi:MAG TPA: dicarboxylate/amino acid:cation symporter, partial [Candidatus Gracilibacteria bacterium]